MKHMARVVVMSLAAVCVSLPAKADDTTSADKKFLADSAQDSMAEIAVAKLALSKTGDPNIKEFASKMVKDHTMLIESMKPLAVKMGVKPPSGPSVIDKARYEELKLKSGISFDRAYVEAMVKDQQHRFEEVQR